MNDALKEKMNILWQQSVEEIRFLKSLPREHTFAGYFRNERFATPPGCLWFVFECAHRSP